MLNLRSLRYVIFDWDNTLADTRPLLVAAINKVLAAYNLPEWECSKQKRNPNLSFQDNFPNIFGKLSKEAYQHYLEVYRQTIKKVQPVKGAEKVINYFKQKNIPMLIVSNKDRGLLEAEVQKLYGVENFIKVVGGHEAARDKPYPEHGWFALKGLCLKNEISPDKVWFVGDTAQDSTCAKAMNALPIRIGKSIWSAEEPTETDIVFFENFEQFFHALSQD